MQPVLLSIGQLSISSFGFFLSVAFLSAVFISWKLAKIYDLDEGKILDILILTFAGGILGARIYFVISHWSFFDDLGKIILLNRYPGLSFWGGLLGGIISLGIFTFRARLPFWQIADFASVSFSLGAFWGNIGCFLGGCGYGTVSTLPLATSVVGVLDKRFPVSALEGVLFLMLFFYLWKQVIRFHFNGKISAVFLILLGIIKFIAQFYREDTQPISIAGGISAGHIFSLMVFILGIVIFYKRSKRNILVDLENLRLLFLSEQKRQTALLQLKKSWYNHQINWNIKIQSLPKILKRRLNVKSNPKDLG